MQPAALDAGRVRDVSELQARLDRLDRVESQAIVEVRPATPLRVKFTGDPKAVARSNGRAFQEQWRPHYQDRLSTPAHQRFMPETPPPSSSSGFNLGSSSSSVWSASTRGTWSSMVFPQPVEFGTSDSTSTPPPMLASNGVKGPRTGMERAASSDDLAPLMNSLSSELEQSLKNRCVRRAVSTDTLLTEHMRGEKTMKSMQKWYRGAARGTLCHMEMMEKRAAKLAAEEDRRTRVSEQQQKSRLDAIAVQSNASRARARSASLRKQRLDAEQAQLLLEKQACEELVLEESRLKREAQRLRMQENLREQSQNRSFAHERTKTTVEQKKDEHCQQLKERWHKADTKMTLLQEKKRHLQKMRDQLKSEGSSRLDALHSEAAKQTAVKRWDAKTGMALLRDIQDLKFKPTQRPPSWSSLGHEDDEA